MLTALSKAEGRRCASPFFIAAYFYPSTQSATALAVGECSLLRMSARMGVTSGTTGLPVGLHVRLISQDLRALHLDLFSLPSDFDFLQ